MKLLYPVPPDSVVTQTFDEHVARAKANHWCYRPGNCPSDIYYYGGEDLVTTPPIGCPVKASAKTIAGAIVQNQGNTGYGLNVRLLHADGYYTLYAHLSKVAIKSGDDVEAGQIIGYTGWSGNVWDWQGKKSPGAAHLHFELRHNGIPIDPQPFLVTDINEEPAEWKATKAYTRGGFRLRNVPSIYSSWKTIPPSDIIFECTGKSGKDGDIEWIELLTYMARDGTDINEEPSEWKAKKAMVISTDYRLRNAPNINSTFERRPGYGHVFGCTGKVINDNNIEWIELLAYMARDGLEAIE